MYRNQLQDVFNPGTDLTCVAADPITGRRFTRYAGAMQGSNITIGIAEPGTATAGVAKYDTPEDELVGIARGAGRIVTIDTDSPLKAGQAIQVGTDGVATAHTDGIIVGYAADDAQAGTTAKISLLS